MYCLLYRLYIELSEIDIKFQCPTAYGVAIVIIVLRCIITGFGV